MQTAAIIADEGFSAEPRSVDVTDERSVYSLVQGVVENYRQIDILHNNVGLPGLGTIESTSTEDWDRTLSVNLTGAFLTMKHVLPAMKEPASARS